MPVRPTPLRLAKKRKRLDEYDIWDSLAQRGHWKDKKSAKSWYRYQFEDLSTHEIAKTIQWGPKLNVTNEDFWQRAAEQTKASVHAFNPKQLAVVTNSFSNSRYHDSVLFGKLARACARKIGDFRAVDLAILIKAFSWLGHYDAGLLMSSSKMLIPLIPTTAPKGCYIIVSSYARLNCFHRGLFVRIGEQALAAWPHGNDWILPLIKSFAVLVAKCLPAIARQIGVRANVASSDKSESFNVLPASSDKSESFNVLPASSDKSESFRAASSREISKKNFELFGDDLPVFGSGLSNDAVVIDSIHHSPTHWTRFSDAEYKMLFRSEQGDLVMPAGERNVPGLMWSG